MDGNEQRRQSDDFTAWDDLQSTGERQLAYVLIALAGAAVILLGLWVAA